MDILDTYDKLSMPTTLEDLKKILGIKKFNELVEEIDILTGAPEDFLEIVLQIELESDKNKMALIATNYINSKNFYTEINYLILKNLLTNIDTSKIWLYRNLYLIERSVPPRFGKNYTWVQRLKMFCNTYTWECACVGNYYNGKKLYFKKGSAQRPTNHDKLVVGHGRFTADLYFYDDSIPGTTTDKMVSVEVKFNRDVDPVVGAKKYAKDRYTYDAKYVILTSEISGFNMVHYLSDNTIDSIEKLDYEMPTDLFKIYTVSEGYTV